MIKVAVFGKKREFIREIMQSWAEVLQKSELFVYLHSRCAWKLVPNAPRAGEGPFFGLSSGCVKGSGEG